jgi:simple sugar transport system ATP-binding protein
MKVDLKNIHKHFGPVHANAGINLSIASGTIQGILGENGAGKSTLMKILSGFIQADEGEILLDDQRVVIHTPADSIKHGIGMLHQDPLDFPPMRVIDNFNLGRPGAGFLLGTDRIRNQFNNLQEQYGFAIDPNSQVSSLTVGERQQLEILRLLWLGARVLILDEPTTGISALQKAKLFVTLRKLASEGITIIFVSHKLEDVEDLCGKIAVMCQGKLVGEASPPYHTEDLVRMMFGKAVELAPKEKIAGCETVLSITDLGMEDSRITIKGVNLDVCRGEVIGLAGMEGSGQRLFLKACSGLIRPTHGRITLNGRQLTGKPYSTFLNAGVTYVPAARLEEGLIPGLTLTEHFILAEEQTGLLINHEKAVALTEQRIKEFSVRGRPTSQVEKLSGGNQQRALLALLRTPLNVILLEHPTRGLDIESSIYIWNKLKERCRQGTSILFISADLEEILQYSDRVLVFFGGKISQPIDSHQTDTEKLGQMIGGKGW